MESCDIVMNRMNKPTNWMRLAALCVLGYCEPLSAQTSPPVILKVDLENYVQY